MPSLPKHLYRFGEFTLDTDQEVLIHSGKTLPLTPKAFDTLLILIESGGRIVRKEDLMERLWPNTYVEEANLTFNIHQIRKALGDNAREPLFVETVARKGYRFIADLEELPDESSEAAPAAQDAIKDESHSSLLRADANDGTADMPAGRGEQPGDMNSIEPDGRSAPKAGINSRWSSRTLSLTLAGLLIVLLLGGWLLWRRSLASPPPPQAGDRIMIAVLPFQNLTGDTAQDYFSDGLTEEMISQLGNLNPAHLGVIARTSVMHYKNADEPLDKIGRELGVQYVLEGSVRRDPDRVRVTAQLIRVQDQSNIWSQQYDRELRSVLAIQHDIGQEIANEIELALDDRKANSPDAASALSPQAYEAYDLCLKGQYFWNKRTIDGFQQAIDYYQRAAEKDPSYARAYAGLANSYALMGGYSGRPNEQFMQKARAAAMHALELDEGLAEAHTALGLIVQNYDWDWQAAEREFRRAIELNPNYATAHHWYAEHLMWRGRFDEALSESEQARKLDPLSLIISADKGVILYYARQYDPAIEQFWQVREFDPGFARARMIVFAYFQKQEFAEAFDDIEKYDNDKTNDVWYWAFKAYIYNRTGQPNQATESLKVLQEMNRRGDVDAGVFAWAHLGDKDNNEALTWLEKAYEQHSNTMSTLKVEPAFDILRNEPRFQDLLRRVHLDQ